jgi:cGMP-dependent protein kinase
MSQEIIIRDLKPDNFIIDDHGYLKMISFGSAKIINQHHKTSTVIGTPHYMAPEIILGKEYNELVDLWSIGVMLFEFMVGELPFGGNTENPYDIYESIIQGNVEFPRNFKDRRAKKLIETMLSLNPEARYNGSYTNLKTNPWFESISWVSHQLCRTNS